MDEMAPKKLTYDEMLVVAQSIHPEMKLRVTGTNKDEWEMFLPSNHIQPSELSDRFKGTPAWELLNTPYHGYENALENHRHKKKLGDIPLDGVAEHINLHQVEQDWAAPIRERLQAENGADFSWDEEVTNEQFIAYQQTQREVRKLMDAEFKDKWVALQEKWRY